MNTKLTIKNFRVFDEDGVSVDLAPITILTGCNSSGKSSIVKALLLLDSFLKQIKKDVKNNNPINLGKKIDFTSYPNSLLGNFDKVVHYGTNKTITFEYSVYSMMLSKDVIVRLVFSGDTKDGLNNAYLESISMSTDAGVFFSSSKTNNSNEINLANNDGNFHNYSIIRDDFIAFFQIHILLLNYIQMNNELQENKLNKEKFENDCNKIFTIFEKFGETKLKNIINLISKSGQIIHNITGDDYTVVKWTLENGSFFMIPIISELDNMPKEQLWSFIESIIKEYEKEMIAGAKDFINSDEIIDGYHNDIKNLLVASRKIVDDFINSKIDLFSQYFKMYEDSFFCSHKEKSNLKYYPTIKSHLGIYQGYLHGPYIDCGDDDIDEAKEFEMWKSIPINFDMIYEVVMHWNSFKNYDNDEYKKYYKKDYDEAVYPDYEHRILTLLNNFEERLLQELITPEWSGNIDYVSSSRISVNRLYSFEPSTDFSQLLKKYFDSTRNNNRWYKEKNDRPISNTNDVFLNILGIEPDNSEYVTRLYKQGSFMNKWIKIFGIGDSVSLDVDDEGLGVKLRLHKTEGDKGRLLADEGYGITQLVSILLQIETSILASKEKVKYNYYGFDKAEIKKYIEDQEYEKKYETITISIEEPEIHLHPSYQSLLADMFLEAYQKYGVHFIIETHSEYLIRKLQVLVAKKGEETNAPIISKNDISILYVNSPKDITEDEPQVKSIEIGEDGRIKTPFGSGFFDEADNHAMELLRLKVTQK